MALVSKVGRRGDVPRPPAGGRGRRRALDGDRWAHHGRSVDAGCGRERVARYRALARGHRGPRRGRLRALHVRPRGCRPGGDVEGPRDAEMASLAQIAHRVSASTQFEECAASRPMNSSAASSCLASFARRSSASVRKSFSARRALSEAAPTPSAPSSARSRSPI